MPSLLGVILTEPQRVNKQNSFLNAQFKWVSWYVETHETAHKSAHPFMDKCAL